MNSRAGQDRLHSGSTRLVPGNLSNTMRRRRRRSSMISTRRITGTITMAMAMAVTKAATSNSTMMEVIPEDRLRTKIIRPKITTTTPAMVHPLLRAGAVEGCHRAERLPWAVPCDLLLATVDEEARIRHAEGHILQHLGGNMPPKTREEDLALLKGAPVRIQPVGLAFP